MVNFPFERWGEVKESLSYDPIVLSVLGSDRINFFGGGGPRGSNTTMPETRVLDRINFFNP